MRNFRSSDNRLAAVEGKRGIGVVRLTFADGSTRAVKIARNYHLMLFMHVTSKLRCYPPQPPEGIVLPPPPPEPATECDELINLLGEAVSVEAEQHVVFLRTIHAMCQQMSERKKEKENLS